MSAYETHKRLWRRAGDVEYIRIETRPARKPIAKSSVASVELEWLPARGSGACLAFQALQGAVVRCKTHEASREFYAKLQAFCDSINPSQ